MTCPKCGSSDVTMQMMNEQKNKGCYWLMLFVPVIGWIAWFFIVFKKNHKTVTKALCQKCGHNWDKKK